jgi:hypothetical protein
MARGFVGFENEMPLFALRADTMTLAEAKRRALAYECTLTADGSRFNPEYRVNLRGAPEATAYYTDDLDDAVAAAKSMFKHRLRDSLGRIIRHFGRRVDR